MSEELRPGDVVAGFEVLGVAGRGGMGVVYRARQLDLDRVVALKLIAPALAQDPAFRERFVRESRAAAAIDHPNVIPVFSAGEDAGRLFLAMRLVDGADLRTLVQRDGPLAPADAARVVGQIGSALDAAHERGLVHRDVKPANVLVAGDGQHAYLTDFGLTKRVAAEVSMTGSGRWVGTLGYVAPEQIRGEPVDARADVYALGCVLYFALSAAAPFRRESDEATLYAHLHDVPPPLADVAPGAEPLQQVVARALAKDPDERFPSAGDLGRAALAAVGVAPAPPPERVVARGAAAPGGAAEPDTDEAATPTGATRADTPATALAPPRPSRARALAGPAAALAAGAATVLVTAALVGGGDDDGGAATATTATTPAGDTATTVEVGPRPNDVVLLGGRAWVSSARDGRLTGVRLADRQVRRIALQDPTNALAARDGELFALQDARDRLVRLDAARGIAKRTYALPPGGYVAVGVLGRSAWIARRGVAGSGPDSVLKLDLPSGAVKELVFGEEGVQDLAVGEGAVYVTNRRRDRVSRVRPSDGRRSSQPVGLSPRGVAVGQGRVWVSSFGANVVTRLDPDLTNRAQVAVGQGPIGIAAAASGVWAANFSASTLTRIDPDTSRPVPPDLEAGINPFAVAAGPDGAVVTNLADGTITVVRVRRAG